MVSTRKNVEKCNSARFSITYLGGVGLGGAGYKVSISSQHRAPTAGGLEGLVVLVVGHLVLFLGLRMGWDGGLSRPCVDTPARTQNG